MKESCCLWATVIMVGTLALIYLRQPPTSEVAFEYAYERGNVRQMPLAKNPPLQPQRNTLAIVAATTPTPATTFKIITSEFWGYENKFSVNNKLKECYAKKHGYDFVLDTSPPDDIDPAAPTSEYINPKYRQMYSHKIKVLRKHMYDTSFVMMADADLLVHNPKVSLDQFVDDKHDIWLMDGFEQSSSAFIVRNSEYGRLFVDHLIRTFELNDDDQCGMGNLMVTMLQRQKSNLTALPLNLEPAMPCGFQVLMNFRFKFVAKCMEDELASVGRSYKTVQQQGFREIDRIKLLSPFEDDQRLMAYCCHGGAPAESRFMKVKGVVTLDDALAAQQKGKGDPALFISGRAKETNFEVIKALHADDIEC
eukprot:m.110464 g.110464  ORF g.110464 m.110464 type:complete len:365 (+) comp28044_c0_seq1:260-1354(+)